MAMRFTSPSPVGYVIAEWPFLSVRAVVVMPPKNDTGAICAALRTTAAAVKGRTLRAPSLVTARRPPRRMQAYDVRLVIQFARVVRGSLPDDGTLIHTNSAMWAYD